MVTGDMARWRRAIRDWLPMLIAVTSIAFTVIYVHVVNREFCQVVTGFTAVRVEQPTDPAANPSRENNWEWYERFVALGRSLGC